jgi:hypothetical protein
MRFPSGDPATFKNNERSPFLSASKFFDLKVIFWSIEILFFSQNLLKDGIK